MPLLPLVGHVALRARFSDAIDRGSMPATLLFHGPEGTGKERLALWLGQRLLCAAPSAGEPCGECQQCRLAVRGQHPDLHWYFPRPRLKDSDPDAEDIARDFAEAIEERLEKTGIWAPPAPTDSMYVDTIKALVRRAALTPALARRKVIVVADAHRLIAQEGSEEASNAFLKLLEEPHPDTTIILTTSSPSSLLPTIRSRASAVRVPALLPAEREALEQQGVEHDTKERARTAAAAMLKAATSDAASRYKVAFTQGAAGARGGFSESLVALTSLLHERARDAAAKDDAGRAAGSAQAIDVVARAHRLAQQNVNPQLLTATLLDDLAPLLK